MVIGLILFGVLGLAAGYAIENRAAWFALAVPVLFALWSAFTSGVDGRLLVVLIVALGVTAAAVILGRLLDRELASRGQTS